MDRNSIPQISLTTERNIPFLETIYDLKVYNPGPASLNSLYPIVYFDNKEHSSDFVQILPPYATYETQIKVPFSLLGNNTPDNIKVVVDTSQETIFTNKTQIVVNSLLVLFVFFLIVVILVMIKLKKLNLRRIPATISGTYAKIVGKSTKNQNNV
jgi:hypothetical protein